MGATMHFHTFPVLIALRSWCYWVLSVNYFYDQIVHHLFITTDYDPYDVLWVVHLVLEDMGSLVASSGIMLRNI